ncbi:MAG: discoidin domain-containing protein [Bacteroidetes bacterium]|nr:MAG: discoidin domain-containing protein [Bacteroidota bacterium]
MTVKAVMVLNNKIVSAKPAEQSFTFNKATGKAVQYATPFSKYYPANGPNSLTDGFRGTKDIGKQWHAFNGGDMVATINFGEIITAKTISIGCIQNWAQWVFFPQWIKFETSEDGVNFSEVKTLANKIPATEKDVRLQDFTIVFEEKKIKAVRLTAKNMGKCPKGHPGENQASWIFMDEIIVE